MELKKAFKEHIAALRKQTESYMGELRYEHLIIDAGVLVHYFADDMDIPFRPTPHFNHWCPLRSHGHVLHIHPGMMPRLMHFYPQDFWEEFAPIGDTYWADSFEVSSHESIDHIWQALAGTKQCAYLGPQTEKAEQAGFAVNPPELLKRLDWQRSFKSAYEIYCLEMANERASHGHKMAQSLFLEGASELDIFYGFLQATQSTENELPYPTIICLDDRAAYLHYHAKRKDPNGKVLLIDAGASFESFGSDITRTYCVEKAPQGFKDLLSGMNQLQLELCDAVRPKVGYPELHDLAQQKVFSLLEGAGLISGIKVDEAIEQKVVHCFFPHGLGHMLGVQVHDVGGQQVDAKGGTKPPPARYPKLRTTRDLEESMVLTIEPGVYFIKMLLDPFRDHRLSSHFNWPLIDELIPYGGIRIEDNVVVTQKGHRNLTRQFLP